jgi:hypothetical protein
MTKKNENIIQILFVLTPALLFFIFKESASKDESGFSTAGLYLFTFVGTFFALVAVALAHLAVGFSNADKLRPTSPRTLKRDFISALFLSLIFAATNVLLPEIYYTAAGFSLFLSIYCFGLALIRFYAYYAITKSKNWILTSNKSQSGLIILLSLFGFLYLLIR